MRPQRWTAALLTGLAVAIAAGAGVLLAVHRPGTAVLPEYGMASAAGLAIAGLGLVIAWRVPDNVIGPLLSWAGAIIVFLGARPAYETVALFRPDAVPLDLRVVVLFEESAWWLFVAIPLVLLYFPDGRLPSRRWRFVPWLLAGTALIQQAYGVVEDTPLLGPLAGVPRPYPPPVFWIDLIALAAFIVQLGLAVACAVSIVQRYRRATGVRREQLKWLTPAGIGLVGYPLVCGVEILITGQVGRVALVVGVAALVLFPVALGIGMLRHDLYDVDRVLAASITYAILTVALIGVFAASAVTAGLLLGRDSAAAAALATAACAVVLAPLRRRFSRFVDDRFYPPRRAAQDAVADLQRRIHAGLAQPEELEATLRGALHDDGLRVGVRVPGTHSLVDAAGEPVGAGAYVPVTLAGEQIGVLVSPKSDAAVLRMVAPFTGSVIEIIRLRAELGAALREVRDSRTRIVQAGNAERVRLERDLHDGAQQRLVALGMALRIAQMQAGQVDVDGVLDRAVAELGTAVAELRQIAHGLRPTSLDDGLHAALAGLTRSLPIPVQLHVEPITLPDDLATTAYYVACEAVTNAAKHADAASVAVHVDRDDAAVRIRVQDDGRGGAAVRPGSGLAGLTDRVAALGGSLTCLSPTGGGTVIEAVLPCGW